MTDDPHDARSSPTSFPDRAVPGPPDRLAEFRDYRDSLYGANLAGPTDLISIRVDALDWLVGEIEMLRGRVTYREQTIDKLKAEAERSLASYQAEAATMERLKGLLRELLQALLAGKPVADELQRRVRAELHST